MRVDSELYGLGTKVELEDQLNVARNVTVARLDGYYRFNRAHRLEWTYYSQDRSGTRARLNEDVSIGDVIIPATYSIDTELDVNLAKVSYAWSFINTEPYEFFLDFTAGLDVSHVARCSTLRRDFELCGPITFLHCPALAAEKTTALAREVVRNVLD